MSDDEFDNDEWEEEDDLDDMPDFSAIARRTDSDLPELPSIDEVAETIHIPLERWPGNCHGVSLAIVKAGLIPHARVARGRCAGVPGQHSWIVGPQTDENGNTVLGDCYADNAPIIDPTLWTYRDDVPGIFTGYADEGAGAGWHRPHGLGLHIMAEGRPDYPAPGERAVALDPEAFDALDADAQSWVRGMFGPLTRRGWMTLAGMTVIGWPSDQIIGAMYATDELRHLIPVDRVGMLTTVNPNGLYLHPDDVAPVCTTALADG